MVMMRPRKAGKLTKPPGRPPGSVGVTRRTAIAVMTAAVRQAMGASASVSVSISDSTASFAWAITEGQTINTTASDSFTLATGVPNGSTVSASPDLLPGQTLTLSGSTLSIVGDSTVPTADEDRYTDIGTPWVITVAESPIATIYNRTQGTTFGKVHNGTTWWNCISASAQGDVIEISPGAINETEADCANYFNGLDACGMVIVQGVTVRNIPGEGRWRLFPAGATISVARSGINIYPPAEVADYGGNPRKTIVIEGFDITDQWGTMRDAYGFRLRGSAAASASWTGNHASVTVRNFKLGKTTGVSGSGLQGGAEVLTFEDGHIFDCGQGGYEHNAYVNGKTLTFRGMRSTRSRYDSAPGGLDGHLLKVAGEVVLIEGCAIYAEANADNSALVHFYHGGDCTIRGCLLIQGANPTNGKGSIWYEEQDGGVIDPPHYYGDQGHSLLLEKNVLVSRPTTAPMVWFATGAKAVPIDGADLVVRDNIAAYNTLAASSWFTNAPRSVNWTGEGNSIETYASDDAAFSQIELKKYLRAAGHISGNALSTKRFIWPHGSIDRSDSSRGLG